MFYTIGQNCSLATLNYSLTIVVSGEVVLGDFENPAVDSELGIHLIWVCSPFNG